MTVEVKRSHGVFDRLVSGPDDLEGYIAYALYTTHQCNWIEAFAAAHGREPDADEINAFVTSVMVDDQVDRYATAARDALFAHVDEQLAAIRPEIEREGVTGRIERAVQAVEDGSSFWTQVRVGFVSTLINTAILILLAVGVRLLGIDLIGAVAAIPGG